MDFEQIMDVASYAMLIIVSLVAFSMLLKYVVPTLTLRVNHFVDKSLGRGIKTYKYPDGRAVLYEPHPSIRKYINKYLLFVNEGYKYFKCTTDEAVRGFKLEILMLNNRHKVIDVISVECGIDSTHTSADVLLHPETSYVAINLIDVNGSEVKRLTRSYYTVWQLAAYFLSVGALTFLEVNTVSNLAVKIFKIALGVKRITLSTFSLYLVSSLAIAAAALFIVTVSSRKKGIEVVLNGKK